MILNEITKEVERKPSTLRDEGKEDEWADANKKRELLRQEENQKSVVSWKPIEENCFKRKGELTWVRYCEWKRFYYLDLKH